MNFRLIGAGTISLVLATPAFAMHRGYHHHYGYVHKAPPVHNAPGFGYGSAFRAYGYCPGDDFAPQNDNLDFARRNTFN